LQHCDTKKANATLTINPLDNLKNSEVLIKYLSNGIIYSDDTTINDVLNLNMQTLANNRKKVLDIILQQLTNEKPKGDWTVAILNTKIQEWSNKQKDDKFKPYCQIAIYYLKKKEGEVKMTVYKHRTYAKHFFLKR
jgi:hypothetical protein